MYSLCFLLGVYGFIRHIQVFSSLCVWHEVAVFLFSYYSITRLILCFLPFYVSSFLCFSRFPLFLCVCAIDVMFCGCHEVFLRCLLDKTVLFLLIASYLCLIFILFLFSLLCSYLTLCIRFCFDFIKLQV